MNSYDEFKKLRARQSENLLIIKELRDKVTQSRKITASGKIYILRKKGAKHE